MRYPAKQVYQLLALLGLRKSEVANAAWSEFHPELRRLLQEESKHPVSWQTVDPRCKTWIIPAKRMKGKNSKARDHAVPLSVTALRVLETLPMFDDDYLFSVRRGRPAVNYQSSKRRVDRLMTDELRDVARRRGD